MTLSESSTRCANRPTDQTQNPLAKPSQLKELFGWIQGGVSKFRLFRTAVIATDVFSVVSVHLDRFDRPIRPLKFFRILAHIVLARGCFVRALVAPLITRPRTAKSGADHDLHIRETGFNVAVSLVFGRWYTPFSGHRFAGQYVAGDRIPGEEPNLDEGRCPFECIYAASDIEEPFTKGFRTVRCDGASAISGRLAAVQIKSLPTEPVRVDIAATARVGRVVNSVKEVDPLNQVDLAALRPVLTEEPKRWPYATDVGGQVSNVGNEETVIVGLVRRYAYGVATRTRGHLGVVNAEVDGIRP